MQRSPDRPRKPHGPGMAAVRIALAVASLALVGAFAASVQAGGPGEPAAAAKVRPWHEFETLTRLLAGRAFDVRTLPADERQRFLHLGMHGWKSTSVPGLLPKAASRAVEPNAVINDAWSEAITWSDSREDFAIHVALMPDGNLTLMGNAAFTITPTPLGAPIPPTTAINRQAVPFDFPTLTTIGTQSFIDALYCTASTFLSDGRLFSAGGTRVLYGPGPDFAFGLPDAYISDGTTWTRLPDMKGTSILPEAMRWYPTTTRLADKRILVLGGYEVVNPFITKNLSAETYDPATNSWTVVTPKNALPDAAFSYMYTHVFQLPTPTARGEVLAFGDVGVPMFMDSAGVWRASAKQRHGSRAPGPNYGNGGSTSMLPIRVQNGEWGYNNGSVIMFQGQTGGANKLYLDVYDPVADQWLQSQHMGVQRTHNASVILPDARVLVLGGEDFKGSAVQGRAQYWDPRAGGSLSWGTQQYPEVRGYHNVAVLLPDGRVMFGSGNKDYTRGELNSFRYYYPSYLFGPRPTIQAAQPVLAYDHLGWVTYDGPPPAEIVLIGIGAMTHSFDMNQRHIQLPILASGVHQGNNYSIFGTPENARIAPPGHYMLFILDENHIPSVAKIIQVQ